MDPYDWFCAPGSCLHLNMCVTNTRERAWHPAVSQRCAHARGSGRHGRAPVNRARRKFSGWIRISCESKKRIGSGSHLLPAVEEPLLLRLHVEDVADLDAQRLDLREARQILHRPRLFAVDRADLDPHRRSAPTDRRASNTSERRGKRACLGGASERAPLRGKRASCKRGSHQVSRGEGRSRQM